MKKLIFLVIIGLTGTLFSCSEDWLDTKPKGQADLPTFYAKKGVNDLLIGAYADIDGHNNQTGEGWASSVTNWVWGSVASDDAYKGSNSGDQSQINAIEGFYVDAANSYVYDHWRFYYDGVVRTNDVMRALVLAKDMTDLEKVQVEAQARFLRAHFYFELTIIHGKVPYIDEKTPDPSLVPNDHVLWPEIESDVKFAIDNLPLKWNDKGRASKWAAKAFLSRIYMFQKRYTDAKPVLEDIYNNGGFSLVPSYEMNYTTKNVNNSESIFEIQYAVNDGFTGNAAMADGICGPQFIGSSGFFQPTHSLVSAFRVDNSGLPLLTDTYTTDDILPYSKTGASVLYTGPVDPRLDISIGRPGVPILDWGIHKGDSWVRNVNNGGPYVNKKSMFSKAEKGIVSSLTGRVFLNANNYRKYKLSHVILWLAECEIEIGSLNKATMLVNQIRGRAKASTIVKFDDGTPAANYKVEPYSTDFASKEFARLAVQMETRLEFGMEGNRFFDLVRWGIAGDVMNKYFSVEKTKLDYLADKHFSTGQHEIWPVPQSQIDITNMNGDILVQNVGY